MTEVLTPELPIGIPSCLGILALSSFLRTFRLSLVLVQPDHDLRSHTAWKRVLVLLAFLHHRQDVIIHRSSGIERNHRRLTEWQQFDTILFPLLAQFGKLPAPAAFRRS